jgi:hypothetical protein
MIDPNIVNEKWDTNFIPPDTQYDDEILMEDGD